MIIPDPVVFQATSPDTRSAGAIAVPFGSSTSPHHADIVSRGCPRTTKPHVGHPLRCRPRESSCEPLTVAVPSRVTALLLSYPPSFLSPLLPSCLPVLLPFLLLLLLLLLLLQAVDPMLPPACFNCANRIFRFPDSIFLARTADLACAFSRFAAGTCDRRRRDMERSALESREQEESSEGPLPAQIFLDGGFARMAAAERMRGGTDGTSRLACVDCKTVVNGPPSPSQGDEHARG